MPLHMYGSKPHLQLHYSAEMATKKTNDSENYTSLSPYYFFWGKEKSSVDLADPVAQERT